MSVKVFKPNRHSLNDAIWPIATDLRIAARGVEEIAFQVEHGASVGATLARVRVPSTCQDATLFYATIGAQVISARPLTFDVINKATFYFGWFIRPGETLVMHVGNPRHSAMTFSIGAWLHLGAPRSGGEGMKRVATVPVKMPKPAVHTVTSKPKRLPKP